MAQGDVWYKVVEESGGSTTTFNIRPNSGVQVTMKFFEAHAGYQEEVYTWMYDYANGIGVYGDSSNDENFDSTSDNGSTTRDHNVTISNDIAFKCRINTASNGNHCAAHFNGIQHK